MATCQSISSRLVSVSGPPICNITDNLIFLYFIIVSVEVHSSDMSCIKMANKEKFTCSLSSLPWVVVREWNWRWRSLVIAMIAIKELQLSIICIISSCVFKWSERAQITENEWFIICFIEVKLIGLHECSGCSSMNLKMDVICKFLTQFQSSSIAMNAIMVLAAITSAVLLIISATFACHGLCTKESTQGVSIMRDLYMYLYVKLPSPFWWQKLGGIDSKRN